MHQKISMSHHMRISSLSRSLALTLLFWASLTSPDSTLTVQHPVITPDNVEKLTQLVS
jgi:hypothetical protein